MSMYKPGKSELKNNKQASKDKIQLSVFPFIFFPLPPHFLQDRSGSLTPLLAISSVCSSTTVQSSSHNMGPVIPKVNLKERCAERELRKEHSSLWLAFCKNSHGPFLVYKNLHLDTYLLMFYIGPGFLLPTEALHFRLIFPCSGKENPRKQSMHMEKRNWGHSDFLWHCVLNLFPLPTYCWCWFLTWIDLGSELPSRVCEISLGVTARV